jgi:hypothetical protein
MNTKYGIHTFFTFLRYYKRAAMWASIRGRVAHGFARDVWVLPRRALLKTMFDSNAF